jgi:hypothetical protein
MRDVGGLGRVGDSNSSLGDEGGRVSAGGEGSVGGLAAEGGEEDVTGVFRLRPSGSVSTKAPASNLRHFIITPSPVYYLFNWQQATIL